MTSCPSLRQGTLLTGVKGDVSAQKLFDTMASHWEQLRQSGNQNFEGVSSPHPFTRASVVDLFKDGTEPEIAQRLSLCKISWDKLGLQAPAVRSLLTKPSEFLAEAEAPKLKAPEKLSLRATSAATVGAVEVAQTPSKQKTTATATTERTLSTAASQAAALQSEAQATTGTESSAESTAAASESSKAVTRIGNYVFSFVTDGENTAIKQAETVKTPLREKLRIGETP